MSTAAVLAQYMSIESQLSYVELQCTLWNNKATAMSSKLSKMEKQEDKWESASDTAEEAYDDPSKELKIKGEVFKTKVENAGGACGRQRPYISLNRQEFAESYANRKVPDFDADLLEEYTDLDMEFSTMAAMYDTLKEELQAQKDGLKETVSSEASDTHMLNGG